MAKIKICQLAAGYGYGGVLRVATSLADGLQRYHGDKYDVTYVCRKAERAMSPEHEFKLVELKPRNTKVLWKILEKHGDYDIIHSHDIYALPGLVRRRDLSDIKLVYTHHGIVPGSFMPSKDIPARLFAERCGHSGIPSMDICIAISNYTAEVLKNDFRASRITRIPNSIDLQTIRSSAGDTESSRIDLNGDPKLLNVGTFEKQKAQGFLIRAMSAIAKEFPDVSLTMIGRGREDKRLRKLVKKLGLENRINILGYQEDSILYGHYRDCDVMVVPSYWESFGIPIIEAMAFGKPVVTRRAYAMEEHITESKAGAMFSRDDAGELIDRLRIVMDNYSSYSRAAVQYAGKFDIEKIITEHDKMYQQLIKN